MSEYYNMVLNEDELKWFFDHIIEKPEPQESYMVCLACRGKKLTEEEREYTKVGSRGEMMREELIRTKGGLKQEWNFDIYKQAFYRYNCDKNSLLTSSHVPYPEHAMTVYSVLNPSDEMNCIEDLINEYNTRRRDMTNAARKNSREGIYDSLVKMPKIAEHLKSCHAHNCPRRIWIDFDMDVKKVFRTPEKLDIIQNVIHEEGLKLFGKGNFAILKTSGGFHTLVRKECLKFNPNDFITNVTNILCDKDLFGIDNIPENGDLLEFEKALSDEVLTEKELSAIEIYLQSAVGGLAMTKTDEEERSEVYKKLKTSLKHKVFPYEEFVINPTRPKEQDKEHPWRVKAPMIPTPGCRQYDSYPVIVNKEDFNEDFKEDSDEVINKDSDEKFTKKFEKKFGMKFVRVDLKNLK